ncbi:unnamed protein product, partial [Closterium sp. NIES-53]
PRIFPPIPSHQVEIIKDLPEDKTITVYRCGPLVDLCRGPHIPNTSHVKAFACLKASASYWRGQSDRESLQRVYGISYPDSKKLKEYLHVLEEAKKRDHRVVGLAQDLFFFHPLRTSSSSSRSGITFHLLTRLPSTQVPPSDPGLI